MKLIYIANLRLPTEKAYGIQIAKMCEAFAVNGLDVELVYPYRSNRIREDFFSYYSIKKTFRIKKIWTPDFYLPGHLNKIAFGVKSFYSALALSLYALVRRADYFYTRDELAAYILSFFKKNIIFEGHRFSNNRKVFYSRFKNLKIRLIVISEGLRKSFIDFGFKEQNLLIARDGVDANLFNLDITKEEAIKKTNMPLDKKIVMYTGHLYEWKGADTLLKAAKLISNGQFIISKNVLFVFVGGVDYDIDKFRKKAEGLGNVLILGHKSHKDIPFFLKAADVLVLPNSAKKEISRFYTSPLKLFEYMASGRPIVASALPSIMEIINDRNAVLVKPDDSGSLAEGITKMLNNNIAGEEIAKQALEDVRDYTWQKRAEKIVEFIGL